MTGSELIDHPKADVVPGARIRRPRIAEPHDRFHRIGRRGDRGGFVHSPFSGFFAGSAALSPAGAAPSAAGTAPSTATPSAAASTFTSSTVGGDTVTSVKFVS